MTLSRRYYIKNREAKIDFAKKFSPLPIRAILANCGVCGLMNEQQMTGFTGILEEAYDSWKVSAVAGELGCGSKQAARFEACGQIMLLVLLLVYILGNIL